MIHVEEFVNSVFTSKTYILYKEGVSSAWMVDVGDISPVLDFLQMNHLTVEGVFITHGHFDHIYGLLDLSDCYPQCKVYATEFTKNALASSKLNMSRYHDAPFVYQKDNVVVEHEGGSLQIFEEEPAICFYETPGHNPGCLTMVLGNLVFTGDAYIPGIGVNTQLPYADKQQAQSSVDRILKIARDKIILSGHQINTVEQ